MTDLQNPETLTTPPAPSTESALAELTRASNRLESTIAFLQQLTSPPTCRLKHTPSPSIVNGLTTTRHLLACIEDDTPVHDGRGSCPGTAREWNTLFHARFEECIGVCDVICARVGFGGEVGGRARSDGMNAVKGVVEKLEEGLRVLVRAGNL